MYRSKIELHNVDCLPFMKKCKDNQFDLAIVDPPYGIGASEMTMGGGKKKWKKNKNWDNETPSQEYFKELFRISKNQIIWGGNYFKLPNKRGWIFWDKDIREGLSFSDGELAWTSFDKVLKKCFIPYSGFRGADNGGKIHPTQKPIHLYKWILSNYAERGDRILDTHLGSGSIAIACDELGFDLTACEIDKEYFIEAKKRLKPYRQQQSLFV